MATALEPLNMHGPDDDGKLAHEGCFRCLASMAAVRIDRSAWGGGPSEDDVRAAIVLHGAINELVEYVANQVHKARHNGASNPWEMKSWEIEYNRKVQTEVVHVTHGYWYHGDRAETTETMEFPSAYLWDPDPYHTECSAWTAEKLAKELAERDKQLAEAEAARKQRGEALARELKWPTCRGCGKPATGEVFNDLGGLVACCADCAAASGRAYREWTQQR